MKRNRRASVDKLDVEGDKEADVFSNRLKSEYQDQTHDAPIPEEISMAAQNLPDTTKTVTETNTDTDDNEISKRLQQVEKRIPPDHNYRSIPDKHDYQFKQRYSLSEVKKENTIRRPWLSDFSANCPNWDTTKTDTYSPIEENRGRSIKTGPIIEMDPGLPVPGCSAREFPPVFPKIYYEDCSFSSFFEIPDYQQMIKRDTDSPMEDKIIRNPPAVRGKTMTTTEPNKDIDKETPNKTSINWLSSVCELKTLEQKLKQADGMNRRYLQPYRKRQISCYPEHQFEQKPSASKVKQDNTIPTPLTQLRDVSAGSNSDSFPYLETTKTDTRSAREEDRWWSTKMEPVVPQHPTPALSYEPFPPTPVWDFSAGSNSDSSHYQPRAKRLIDSTMEIENKRKNDQLVVRGNKRNVGPSIKLPLDQFKLEMTQRDSTSTVPSPAGIVPGRRQKLGMDGNRSNHPLLTSPLMASLDTLPSDTSLYKTSNIITNSPSLTAPHLSESQNKAILTKEGKDMMFGWKTNPAASTSLDQGTLREKWKPTLHKLLQSSFDSREQDTFNPSFQSSSLEEINESAGPVNYSVPIKSVHTDLPDTSRSGLRRRDHSNSSPSLSWPLIPQDPPADVSNLPRAASLPNMKLQSSFEEFTPDFTGDEDDETYWLRCSSPGLYQCRVSGLVFDMKGEGDVSYSIVPWSSRLLSQHGKKPAGPLFDIRCQQQSVAQLHLPHCEIPSTGGCTYLSVAHIGDHGIEFIRPEKITETHVIVNITVFSAFGNVKDEDSPPDPVRALVLLFYKPPADPESDHQINVLLLPKNVVLRHVLRFRKKLDGGEKFLESPPDCRLQPKQLYTLSTRPEEDSVLVQPKEAEFDAESCTNYLTTFQVVYENFMRRIKMFLRDGSSSAPIWNREVCLSTAGVRRAYGPTRQNVGPSEHLKERRTIFIDGISGPVVKSLLDKLLEINVLSDAEMEEVEKEKTRGDKARVLVDTVRRKGDDASSEMIRFLSELDPFFSKHLGLI